jgi:hypothetical protein
VCCQVKSSQVIQNPWFRSWNRAFLACGINSSELPHCSIGHSIIIVSSWVTPKRAGGTLPWRHLPLLSPSTGVEAWTQRSSASSPAKQKVQNCVNQLTNGMQLAVDITMQAMHVMTCALCGAACGAASPCCVVANVRLVNVRAYTSRAYCMHDHQSDNNQHAPEHLMSRTVTITNMHQNTSCHAQ